MTANHLTPGQQQYEAGREAHVRSMQCIAIAANLENIHPTDMNEVVRLREQAKDLRIKAANFGFTK
jgi:hypothetical protein